MMAALALAASATMASERVLVAWRDAAIPAPAVLLARDITQLSHPAWQVLTFGSEAEALRALTMIRASGLARAASLDRRSGLQREQFIPNDPIYAPSAPWSGQWYLKNQVNGGPDLNVAPAWLRGLIGQSVMVGAVDDGFEFNHPDLVTNYSSINSRDFGQSDGNPFPVSTLDNHGTAVIGLFAGRGGNSIGITGTAPSAPWAGLRCDFDTSPISHFVDATLYRSSGATTTIKIKNHSYGYFDPFVEASALALAMEDSAAAGTMHVRSAGNYRGGAGEDANKHAERNTSAAITVGAIGSNGLFAPYSNFGANLFVCAPSTGGGLEVLTTDRTTEANGYNGGSDSYPDANYTSVFGGTSAAAPLVAGVLALGKQANPALDTRLAKHALARTSRRVDLTQPSWTQNAAGFWFNPNYGFGLVDADAFTLEVNRWARVTPSVVLASGNQSFNAAIPDNLPAGVDRTFTISGAGVCEEVLVSLEVTHAYRGDLEGFLISPSGTTTRLFASTPADTGANFTWTFSANAFWGEPASGIWTVRLVDTSSLDTGTWVSGQVQVRTGRVERDLVGHVDLLDYSGTVAGTPVTLEVGSQTFNVNLDASGNFTLPVAVSGETLIRAKASHWLAKAVTQDLDSPSEILTFSLINGDIDGDNEVGPGDFGALSVAFLSVDGDPNWNPEADLDGDGEVGPGDFSILSNNFLLAGD